ncbi:MAG: glycosyltransferase family 4 protein [Cyanobacteria bacterium J06634_6]
MKDEIVFPMKILLYSSVFFPSVGGIETITATLASNIISLGHKCIVVTETPIQKEQKFDYEVVRNPTWRERLKITKGCDIIHSNGASVAMFPFAKLCKKPFVWTHNGYQVACVDGLGWLNGSPAPITPRESLLFHLSEKGFFHFLKEAIKLNMRRYVADRVDLNIAATHWVAKRQPLKNQVVAYTPYPLEKFTSARQNIPKKYDFIYVGRLVSEKGIDTLLNAFQHLISEPEYRHKTLAVVGGGGKKEELETLTNQLNLQNNVYFLGSHRGDDLIEIIEQAEIGVVPSIWEEPMGGVSLELLAAGKKMIVSEFGGHAECLKDASLSFPNGDYVSLSQKMKLLISDHNIAKKISENATLKIQDFNETELTKKYVEIYEKVLSEN